MPIYEYHCNRCGREFSHLSINSKRRRGVSCKFCRGKDLTRLLSSFSVHQTEESRLSQFDSSKRPGDGFYKDSRNVGLWTKKKMRELGVDLGPKIDEIVEEGRTGKILEGYEK
jgi:putative FmdB family regulatory protein